MDGSLKDQNRPTLWTVMAVNLVLFYAIANGGGMLTGDWMTLLRDVGPVIFAGVGIIFTGIVNHQLPEKYKARIVFMRWNNPLPGSYAFTEHATSDPRIDIRNLEQKFWPLPEEPLEQNRLWYTLYVSVESDVSVRQVHRNYLLARDYTCLALMMVILLGVLGLFLFSSLAAACIYIGVLVVQFLLAGQAARNHGKRFVTTVLAKKGAEAEGSNP